MIKSLNSIIATAFKFVFIGGICCSQAGTALAQGSVEQTPQIRYVLKFWPYYKKIEGKRVTSVLLPPQNSSDYGSAFDIRNDVFHLASDINKGQHEGINESTGEEFIYEDHIAILIMEVDEQSRVISSKRKPSNETKITVNDKGQLVATAARDNKMKSYIVGNWLTSLTTSPARFTPTLCEPHEMPTPENKKNYAYRYGEKADPEQYNSGGFGCREWAYQLYDPTRPYIDVTSYLRTPRIHTFIGWARAGDKKPIIGLENNWMCLYECPNGDKPGVIADIVAWAKKNGWEPPQRPVKVPMFPDPIR